MSGLRRNSRGDTIIEVMFAMAIIGVVLAAAYATASKNLQTSQLAKERTQASKIAEAQLEQLKILENLDEITEDTFCLDIEQPTAVIETEIAVPVAECTEGFYEKSITKDGADYTVVVSWIPPGGSDTNKANVTFYYSDYDFDLSISSLLGVYTVSYGTTSARIGATVISGGSVQQRGIVYGPVGSELVVGSADPLVNDTQDPGDVTTTAYEIDINGLSAGTEYIVRAWVLTAASGYEYSATITIGTSPASPASVETVDPVDPASITPASANISGNVTADNGSPVTSRGIAYGTSPNPTIAGSFEPAGSGEGNFSVNIAGLSPDTRYYARAYATNSEGTSYGARVSFETLGTPPGLTFDGSFGGSSYFVSNSEATISEARSAAVASGGHLVTISSADENNYVSNLANGQLIWIGFNDRNNEGNRQSGTEDNWVWDTGEPVTYVNWRLPNEPNDYDNGSPGEDVAVMNWAGDFSGLWNDWFDNTTDRAFYVIEYD